MYRAAKTIPKVAITAATGYRVKVPTHTRNSLTKLERPGSAKLDRPAIKNDQAMIGVTRCSPPKSEIVDELRREIINPATKKSAAVENPWLNMYSVEHKIIAW